MQYQKISLLEFDNLCKQQGYNKFYFAGEDNPSLQEDSSISLTTQFDKMAVFLAPDSIMFKNDYDVLSFHGVKNISARFAEWGDIFLKIICETVFDNKTKTYNFLATKIEC